MSVSMKKMVELTVDGQPVRVLDGSTSFDEAARVVDLTEKMG